MQRKPAKRGGKHWTSLIPVPLGESCAQQYRGNVTRAEAWVYHSRKERPPPGCQRHINKYRLSLGFLQNWDSVKAQSLLQKLLWLKDLNGKCFTRKRMFSFCFCNLTVAAGEIGVPDSESKVDWPGTESKWTCVFFFFFWQVGKEIKKKKRQTRAWRGK